MKPPRGAMAGVAGVVASGIAAGALAEHRLVRRRVRPVGAPEPENFPTLDGTRQESVTCTDGVRLAVRERGPRGGQTADLTLVYAHGYTVTSECWASQVRDLAELAGIRQVLYDQRGHGASETGPPLANTLEQLGSDLAEVLAQRVPEGPILLVGHSMGGMTIMALAESRPELFGDRIVGTALIGTSSGGMGQVSLGLPAAFAAVPGRLLPYAPRAAPLNRRAERLRAADSDLGRWVNSKVAFGPHVSGSAQTAMARMQAPMRLETMGAFLATFADHDRATALAPLKTIPTLIMVGERDVLTPPDHSRAIAEALPDAEFVVVPAVGHMTMMEAPDVVTDRLRGLIERVS